MDKNFIFFAYFKILIFSKKKCIENLQHAKSKQIMLNFKKELKYRP